MLMISSLVYKTTPHTQIIVLCPVSINQACIQFKSLSPVFFLSVTVNTYISPTIFEIGFSILLVSSMNEKNL